MTLAPHQHSAQKCSAPRQDRRALQPADAGLSLPEVAAAVRVPQGALRHARELGILPLADIEDQRWSPAACREIQERWPAIAAELKRAEEFGAVRCAELLSRLTGLAVSKVHIEKLAAEGMLSASRIYRDRPLYRSADVRALAADPLRRAFLTEIAPFRETW